MMELIALCVITGHGPMAGFDGDFVYRKSVAVGIKGDVDAEGSQVWYDTIDTLRRFHPEARDLAA